MSDKLSVVLIQIDSLNRHFLRCHGNGWVDTPNMTRFAERASVFDSHYVGSLPCMPARREIWTGTEEFWWRSWGPLEPWDVPIAYLLGQNGITSQLVTDHYHFLEWGSHSYNYDYTGYEYIRGHEYDNWRTTKIPHVPDWARKMVERRPEDSLIYLQNAQYFSKEDDFFGPRVMDAARQWLSENHELDQFFLHVDCFDVHEPFHVPEPYRSMYTDLDYQEFNPWPIYGPTVSGKSALSDTEIGWVRAQYAGKLTMVDKALGKVLNELERLNLMARTCVIITTDHGHFLGDHGWMGKPWAPVYDTIAHIPLLVWHPDSPINGQRVSAITQTVDLYATVLDLLDIQTEPARYIHSRSLVPIIRGEKPTHRDHAVYSYNSLFVGVTTGEWTLLRDHDPARAEAYWYTHQIEQLAGKSWRHRRQRKFVYEGLEAGNFIPGLEMPVWKMPAQGDWIEERGVQIALPRDDLLFHNPSDPDQLQSLAESNYEEVQRAETVLLNHAREVQAPEEQLLRLRLV